LAIKNGHNLSFRIAKEEDLIDIKELFVQSIIGSCSNEYNTRQMEAWTSSIKNHQKWLTRIRDQYFLLAFYKERLAGICSLLNLNYLDLLFVHPEFQGQGIAKQLYSKIENKALNLGKSKIKLHSSLSAENFFKKMGFKNIEKRFTLRDGEKLIYFIMVKDLSPKSFNEVV